jgi:hypothetical protein
VSTKQRADIEQYIDHFRTKHAELEQVEQRLHCKVLVVTMLDALARGRYPKARSRERFVKLIEDHSNWPHATAVSASQLAMMLQQRGGAATCRVSDEFVRRLHDSCRRHKPSRIDGLDIDPTSDELLSRHQHELRLANEAKHSSLLYQYRCVLVHEYREPGYGFEFDKRELAPFYHEAEGESGTVRIELVYPAGWFLALVPPILDSLATYYVHENQNPYDSYDFGSPWRKA